MSKFYTMAEATRITKLTRSRLQSIAEKVGAEITDGFPDSVVETIVNEQKKYISFRDYAAIPRGERYDGSTKCKRALQEELEINDYFGIDLIESEELLIGTNVDVVYFHRSDIHKLDEQLAPFFLSYAYSEKEKVDVLLAGEQNKKTKKRIRKFLKSALSEREITPAVTEFVSLALLLPNANITENADIQRILKSSTTAAAKNMLIQYLNYVRKEEKDIGYSKLRQVKKESIPIPAYSDETYIVMARCFFNSEYIAQHRMIERAIENHLYIEMWLYLALNYCCGWRAADICRGWRYLNLKDKPDNAYGINIDTLQDDILNNRLPDTIYEDVCKYATGAINVAGQVPAKTSSSKAPPLVISIEPALTTFFGLLTLISEAVMLRTGDGYMKVGRQQNYQKAYYYRAFFGQELYDTLNGQNIQSRRLNKSYLQGIEETARQSGCGALMASAIASFARSHNNLDTISHYLRDHRINGENAEMVLYYMMERGVFGFELYQTLLTAYPDVLRQLPLRQQNAIMAAVTKSPYQIELEQSGLAAKMTIKDCMESGDMDNALIILKSMFEISQGRAKGKDEGIHCIPRACGGVCVHPEYDSCLANTCPHLVFTRYGYRALLEVIVEYKQAADSGNVKMKAVLQSVIMPRFRDLLNELMRDMQMTRNERMGLKRMLEEVLENGS